MFLFFLVECTTHKHLIHDSGGTVAYDAVSSAMCSSHESRHKSAQPELAKSIDMSSLVLGGG